MGQSVTALLDVRELSGFTIHITSSENKTPKKIKFLVVLQQNKAEKQKYYITYQ